MRRGFSRANKPIIMERNIAALLREDARTVQVTFRLDEPDDSAHKLYTYITHLPCKPGDLAVADAAGHMKVVRITRCDDGVSLEPGDTIKYNWLIDIIDSAAAVANAERNLQIELTVAEAYKTNLRRSFSQQILSGLTDESKAAVLALTGRT